MPVGTRAVEGRRGIELLPVEKDLPEGMDMIKYLAMIAAWGRRERSRVRAAWSCAFRTERPQLWRVEIAAVLGPAPRRSTLPKNRRLARVKAIAQV